MKKFSILLVMMALLAGSGAAFAAPRNNLMEVRRLSNWNPEYLTVTWSGCICYSKESQKTVDYILSLIDVPTRADNSRFFEPTDRNIYNGSYVVSVDGRDAKNWRTDDFYDAMSSPRRHTLVLGHPYREGTYEVVFDGTYPVWMQAQGFHPLTCKWESISNSTPSERFKIRMDNSKDWSKFKTFDWYISTNDVLADKELLEKIDKNFRNAGMKRDEINPDIVFTLSKDANQSIDFTYVPKTEQQVMTGSTSKAVYGWKGSYLGSVTSNNYQTVTSGGYTQKTTVTKAYLEVTILEASRLGEKYAPVIWQMKYNYTEDTAADVDKLYDVAITWVDHPINDMRKKMKSKSAGWHFYNELTAVNFGIILNGNAEVIGLDKASDLVKKSGIKKGDVITDSDFTYHKPMSSGKKGTYSGKLTVNRNGHTEELNFSGCRPANLLQDIEYHAAYTDFE